MVNAIKNNDGKGNMIIITWIVCYVTVTMYLKDLHSH